MRGSSSNRLYMQPRLPKLSDSDSVHWMRSVDSRLLVLRKGWSKIWLQERLHGRLHGQRPSMGLKEAGRTDLVASVTLQARHNSAKVQRAVVLAQSAEALLTHKHPQDGKTAMRTFNGYRQPNDVQPQQRQKHI